MSINKLVKERQHHLKNREGNKMDFKRSTIVLIISFICLNIFLLFTYIQLKREVSLPLSNNVDIIEQMKSDGIVLSNISHENNQAYIVQAQPKILDEEIRLQNQTFTLDQGVLSATLSTPISISNESLLLQEEVKAVEIFVKSKVFNGAQYQWVGFQALNKKMVYAQTFENIPILDGTAQLTLSLNNENEWVSYEQTYVDNLEAIGEIRTLVSSQEAVEALYLAGFIPAKAVVAKVKLMYYQTLKLNDVLIYTPAWSVEIQSSEATNPIIRKVDAIRGTILATEVE